MLKFGIKKLNIPSLYRPVRISCKVSSRGKRNLIMKRRAIATTYIIKTLKHKSFFIVYLYNSEVYKDFYIGAITQWFRTRLHQHMRVSPRTNVVRSHPNFSAIRLHMEDHSKSVDPLCLHILTSARSADGLGSPYTAAHLSLPFVKKKCVLLLKRFLDNLILFLFLFFSLLPYSLIRSTRTFL